VVDFTISAEHEQFAESIRGYFASRQPMTEVRRLAETPAGYERGSWKQLADEVGVQGLAIPERFGGSGFGYEELGIAFEAAGGCLTGLPLLSTSALATPLLVESGDEAAQLRYLGRIASGELVATLALSEGAQGISQGSAEVVAERKGGGYLLSGEKRFVLDGASADLLLVPAMSEAGLSVFAVDLPDDKVTATPWILSTSPGGRRTSSCATRQPRSWAARAMPSAC
jgi:alkylation response protein AidB-like acyl-CoA dehydrogenase